MKKVNIYIAALVGLLSIISCTQREEVDFQEINVDKIFSAYMADDSITKTMIDGEIGDEYRKTLWLPGDSVGIAAGYGKPVEKFVNTNTSASELALLEGSISSSGESYYAIYPYHSSLKMESGFFTFDIPANQKYQKNSFAPDAAPMVARLETDNANQSLYFKNLCGVLIINLTGKEKVKSITFTGKNEAGENMKVSGKWSVDMTYTDTPIITPTDSSSTSVTLQCEEGVQLDPVTPTPFYIVLPPATYHTFSVSIITEDDKFMYKEGTKPLIIRKANITSSSALIFVETAGINLSAEGTANSYIVPNIGGRFIFDASVKGNSTELVGTPASAEVLWETKNTDESVSKGDIISSVSLMDGGFVQFSIPTEYTPGNALIAVKDADGVILWSWHIWVADFDPVTTQQTYQSGAVMMDRNMGSLNVQENDPRANGLFYLWGRKDPMCGAISSNSFAQTYPANIFTRDVTNSITEAIQNPTHFGNTPWSTDNTLWASAKTKYDPCPAGWRVPDGGPDGVWSGFGAYSQDVTNGAYFDAPYSTPRAFYPRGGYAYCGDMNIYFYGAISCHWSCAPVNNKEAYTFALWNGQGESDPIKEKQSLFNVRCQKDESQSAVSIPAVQIKEVKDVTQDGVTVVSEVVRDGRSSVIEKGVLVGETSDLTIDNALKVVKSESAEKEFTLTVNDLLDGTKYYVRSYAKNSAGIGYSEARSFTTVYSGNVRDLSANGTANSYIVNKYGIYSFNATVKGNSTTPLEATPVSAEVLWETRNTSESITVGCVVKDVTFEDGRVKFATSDDVTPGNALIAVKDADGYILWSWHIWVVDYNPEVQYHTYPSGAVMMDRDLGALSNGTDVQSNGLLYQWGRKDPFMGVGGNNVPAVTAPAKAVKYEKTSAAKGTLAYVETIPQVMLYNDANWKDWMYTYNNTLWSEEKTLYDPCPSGWKVPSYEDHIWDGLSGVTYLISGYAVDGTNADFGTDHWTSTARTDDNGRVFTKRGNNRGKVSPARVRCIRESELKIEEVASTAKSSAASVTAAVTSGTLSSIEEYGVVISDANNQKLVITNENIMVIKGDSSHTGLGELNVNIEDLSPNTRYFYRVYVIGDNGIEYSQMNTFDTKSSGHNENVGDEDYEW